MKTQKRTRKSVAIRKSPKMQLLEMQHGRDICLILKDAVEHHGTMSLAAEKLGIPYPTLQNWMRVLKLEARTVVDVPATVQEVAS